MDQKRKMNKFTPFDRVLDGLEQEDLIDEDIHTKIIKVYSKKKNNKMFLLEKIITNEKDHLRYIDEIHKYEILQSDGLLNIEKWTYDMLIDQKLTKQYKFILVFDTYAQNLRQYLDTVSAKQLQLMREDIVNLFKVIIQSLAYMQQKNINHFNPVCMSSVVLCSDTNVKFNCIPLLMTPHSQIKAKQEAELYLPPEKYKNPTIAQIYQQAVYSFGLIFIQIFLTRNVDNLNSKPEIVKQCLKELQQKYGDTYTKYLEGMVETDPNKRLKLQDLAQIIQNSEPLKLSHNSIMSKISFSESFEYFRKSYQIQGYSQIKSIATALPWTRFILLSNLFNIKNYFLELIDLQMSFLIAEKATTILVGQFKVLIAGGLSSKHIYELDDEIPTLNQIAQFPGCLAGRWGFGYAINKNHLYICSGYLDNNLINQCHKLDLETHHWSHLPQCIKPVLGCTLVFFHDQLFKIGGISSGGKSSNVVEKFDGQWRLINFRMPNFCLPSFSFGLHANPGQIFLLGGSYQTQQERIDMTKVIIMNIDLSAHIVESGEDFVYIEFFSNDALEYGKFGAVQQISVSNNQLFLLQKKDDRYHFLTQYENQSFVEIRKIKI